jgi:hypothetical protein
MHRNRGYVMGQDQRQQQTQTIRQRFYWLVALSDYEPAIAGSLLSLTGVAGALLWYPRVFAVSPQNFGTMAAWGSQSAWGQFAGLLIGLSLISTINHWHLLQATCLFFIFMWWSFLGGMFVLSAGFNITANVFVGLAIQALWALWRFAGRGYLSPYGRMRFRRSRVG